MPDIYLDVDTALAEVPVNILPLTDDTDFKTRETAVAYNAAGMDLVWNFVTSAGAFTQTAVTPTTAGDYDWTHQGDGMYTIEIPASGGASINNDTEGYGWFTGFATGVLPWRGPVIGFRAAGLNDLLCDSAYSTTRGLSGTALPAAAADAAGGLPISDAGGLDMDAILSRIGTPANLGGGATLSQNLSDIESQTDDIGVAGAGLTALASQASVNTIDDFLDTEIAAIKAKTDQLTFTTANQVDATTVTNSDKTGYSLTADFRIKKNTALANFVFLMVDSSDAPVTGATVTAQMSLDGAALAAMTNSVVEISNGLYKINLAAADTNADTVCYRFTATGCKDRVVFFATQTE